jgi:hypothetical protein
MLSDSAKEAAVSLRTLLERADLTDEGKASRIRVEHAGHVAEVGEVNGLYIGRVTTAEERIVAIETSEQDAVEKIKALMDEYRKSAEDEIDNTESHNA